jgi:hypothetical protein
MYVKFKRSFSIESMGGGGFINLFNKFARKCHMMTPSLLLLIKRVVFEPQFGFVSVVLEYKKKPDRNTSYSFKTENI